MDQELETGVQPDSQNLTDAAFIARKRYETILRRVGDLPSLPDVVNSIMDLLVRPNASAQEIAKLISYDPGLTSKFLRMVNSAAYGFQRQISSVQHAIMILGFSTVRGVVLSASIFKLFERTARGHGLDPTEFWQHSIATAIGSRILATKFRVRYAEDAFSAGMLHDIGKMIFDNHFRVDYAQVLAEARIQRMAPHGDAYLDLEKRILYMDHAELGHQLALRWKLPATFIEVIRYHHDPASAMDAPELVYVVALANAFSRLIHENFGVFNPSYIPLAVLEYFNYDPENPEEFETLFKQVVDEMDNVEDLLSNLKR